MVARRWTEREKRDGGAKWEEDGDGSSGVKWSGVEWSQRRAEGKEGEEDQQSAEKEKRKRFQIGMDGWRMMNHRMGGEREGEREREKREERERERIAARKKKKKGPLLLCTHTCTCFGLVFLLHNPWSRLSLRLALSIITLNAQLSNQPPNTHKERRKSIKKRV